MRWSTIFLENKSPSVPGPPLAQPHPYLSFFLLTFDSLYYILIHSNHTKTNEIVRMLWGVGGETQSLIWLRTSNFLEFFYLECIIY